MSDLLFTAASIGARALTFSLAALILYFPSNFYPIITADYQGRHVQTTIFRGIRSLFERRQYFIASLIFCTGILTPVLKIIGLIFITLTLDWPYRSPSHFVPRRKR